MKVVAINGSARKEGNTAKLINTVLQELEKESIDTEVVNLAGKEIGGCTACMKCWQKKNGRCAVDKDFLNKCLEKMTHAHGIILGSPTYFANVSAEMKALIDRAGMVGLANDFLYRRKVGAGVVAVRRGGAIHVFNSLNHFFFINQMVVPGSIYWNMGTGLERGEVEQDEEGLRTMQVLGENMAWLLKKLNA